MYQSVTILGNLGKDAELKHTPSGLTVVNFSVATTERWKDQSGQKQERTEWFNCVAYDKLAQVLGNLKKGETIFLVGKLKTRSWEDNSGGKRYATDFVISEFRFIGSKPESRRDSFTSNDIPF